MMVAEGGPLKTRLSGSTERVDGVVPKVHVSEAPAQA